MGNLDLLCAKISVESTEVIGPFQMDHVAIMKKSWGLTKKIAEGQKTVESRWYKSRIAPWDRVNIGDTVYFKDSGCPVTLKAKVTKIEQYEISNEREALELMKNYSVKDLGVAEIPDEIMKYIAGKRYAVFIHFDSVEEVAPFEIDKTGYGSQCAWISVEDVAKVRI